MGPWKQVPLFSEHILLIQGSKSMKLALKVPIGFDFPLMEYNQSKSCHFFCQTANYQDSNQIKVHIPSTIVPRASISSTTDSQTTERNRLFVSSSKIMKASTTSNLNAIVLESPQPAASTSSRAFSSFKISKKTKIFCRLCQSWILHLVDGIMI